MKSLLSKLGVILVVVIIFYPSNSFAEIEIKYDRFKNKTSVCTDIKKTSGTTIQPALILIGYYDGQKPSRPGVCQIGFNLISSFGWTYLRCHSLACLADGKPVELPPSKHEGRTGRGYVIEHIYIRVPFSIVEQLSKCEKVEFKLCNREFSLLKYEMEDLKIFVKAFLENKSD